MLGHPLFLYVWIFITGSVVSATLVNRTIDDEEGDSVTGSQPQYSPATGEWNLGPGCTTCNIHPDPALAFDNTWHDTTYFSGDQPLSVTLSFTGVAVYVYCIIANTPGDSTTTTSLTFTLDGESVGPPYVHNPVGSDFEYNVPVYINEDMSNELHSLQITADNGANPSLFLFDYAEYTFDEPDPSPPSSPSPASSPTSPSVSYPSSSPSTTFSAQPSPISTPPSPSLFASRTSAAVSTSGKSTNVAGSPSQNSIGSLSLYASPTSSVSNRSPSSIESNSPSNSQSSVGSTTTTVVLVQSKSSSLPAAIGGVLAGIALIAFGVIAFCVRRRRRRSPHLPTIDPVAKKRVRKNGGIIPFVMGAQAHLVERSDTQLLPSSPTFAEHASDQQPRHLSFIRPETGSSFNDGHVRDDHEDYGGIVDFANSRRLTSAESDVSPAAASVAQAEELLAALEDKRRGDEQSRLDTSEAALAGHGTVVTSVSGSPQDQDTRGQIDSLWAEVHRLRARQELVDELEPLPSYDASRI